MPKDTAETSGLDTPDYKQIFADVYRVAKEQGKIRKDAEKVLLEQRNKAINENQEAHDVAVSALEEARKAADKAYRDEREARDTAYNEAYEAINEVYSEQLRQVRDAVKTVIQDASATTG
jgi:translation initiation factor 2 alpha subunit (eIF-2alpha)